MLRPALDSLIVALCAAILVGAAWADAPRSRPVPLALPVAVARAEPLTVHVVAHDLVPALSIARQVADGRHWRLDSPRGPVHVWTPHGYAAASAVTVVYVHGYYTDVDRAWAEHRLPEQFALSGINAMFIAASAPSFTDKPVAWPSLPALLHAVKRGVAIPMPQRGVAAVGHSGAYRTLELWLGEPRLDTMVLLDAAYGDLWAYRRWLIASPHRRLITIGDDTIARTDLLHRALPSTVVIDPLPMFGLPEAARTARIVYLRSRLGHMPLVTAGIALPSVLRAVRATQILSVPIPYPFD